MLRIALFGIFKGLVCHRKKRLESSRGKATVFFFFIVGCGSLLLIGLGLVLGFFACQ